FAARGDCDVVDEPFYAAYLALTGLGHPMRADILQSQSQDPNTVIEQLCGSELDQNRHIYQKHMTQHMLPGIPRDWMHSVRNVFLIRHPARVISSYAAKRENPTLNDIGFQQQAELFDEVHSWGGDPVVIDSHDIRTDPEAALRRLCAAIDLEFTPKMLSWATGGHPRDGVWAKHWYGAVWQSTGFADPEGALPTVPDNLKPVLGAALPFYEKLSARKI
ncbi:MAG: HAD family hydrolase, partial [Parasphingorhabdus sp.]|uniref:sulfotransferase-like domain-containing protein n=1 Tax=Parasphingorhabdus sp. TaxID=2709688 RepID=UPI003297DA9E